MGQVVNTAFFISNAKEVASMLPSVKTVRYLDYVNHLFLHQERVVNTAIPQSSLKNIFRGL